MKKVYLSQNEDVTAALAQRLADICKVGDVFALSGTLGAGKSIFARAFIKKLTKAEEVPSPTFTLVQTYDGGNFDIYHYDLYRLENPMEIFELGVEDAFYSGVSLVEWPEKMGGFAPRNMWNINIEITADGRKITIATDEEEKMKRLINV
jgi:tRNA threonylcarbamoyladenosine biosynthesis protein TsaE